MMISRLLKLSFLLCALTLCLGVKAQNWNLYDRVTTSTFYGQIVDSLTTEPLPGAVISVVSAEHSGEKILRNFVSDKKGGFRFTCYLSPQHRMEIAMLGYKPHVAYLTMDKEEQNLGLIRLSQSTQAIDEVVVNARMQMYKMKGDTAILLPKSVKTMRDDPALEILRQMPGVEVGDDGSVKILGKQVERTYVNQKLLFGENPTTALRELDAKEVALIQAYDEVDEADAVINGQNARKRKVLNVVTFKDFTQSYSAKAHGEMGADFNKNEQAERPLRYRASGNANFFSETLQLSANGQSNNLTALEGGRASEYTSQRQSNALVDVSGRSDNSQHRYSAGYSYSGGVNEQRSSLVSDYFATDYFNSQHTESSQRNKSESNNHRLTGSYHYLNEGSRFSSAIEGSLGNISSLLQSQNRVNRDGAALSATDLTNKDRGTSRRFKWTTSGGTNFKDGNSISAYAQVELNGSQSRGVRLEQRTTDGVETPLGWNTYNPIPDNQASGNIGYTLNFGNAGNLLLGTGVDYQGCAERKFYTDIATGQQDLVRSEDAFDKTTTWKIGPHYRLSRQDYSFSAELDYKLENRVYEDAKAGVTDRRNFHFINGHFSYSYNKPKKNLYITLSSNSNSVPARFFTSRIDDSNPLYVTTGNSSLVPTKNYTAMFNIDFLGENSSSYGFSALLSAITDPLSYRSRFFKEQSPLLEYGNYLMPAGSTLTTLENGAAHLQLRVSAQYKVRIAPLRLFLDMSGGYSFANPEETQYDKTARIAHHTIELTTQITTNFSSKFRIRVNNDAVLVSMKRFGASDHDFRDMLTTGVEWDIISNLYLRGNYTGIFSTSSGRIPTPDTHLLCFSFGCRVLKERGHIAINAYDVLNDYAPIRVSQTQYGISREVSYVGANYFTVSFEYKFNNRRAVQ